MQRTLVIGMSLVGFHIVGMVGGLVPSAVAGTTRSMEAAVGAGTS